MRGYGFLKDSKSLARIGNIKQALTIQTLDIKDKAFSEHVFGENVSQVEIICRQYLLARLAGLNLNRKLLYSFGRRSLSLTYCLPAEWRKIIGDHGVKIASFRSTLLWQGFVGFELMSGILRIFKVIFRGVNTAIRRSNRQFGRYVYFNDLSPLNLPQPCRDGRGYDIITWYTHWGGSDVDTLCHGVRGAEKRVVNGIPVVSVTGPIPTLSDFGTIVRFMAWGARASLISIWYFLCGNWWIALLFSQAVLAAQVRILDSRQMAKKYLFHNSGWIYRPMWTYEAERRGSEIIFYFYSSNCEGFKKEDGYPGIFYGYQAMSWSHYLVWDEYQANFVRSAVGEMTPSISVVGPIWFGSSGEDIPEFDGRGVAVFDVAPHRASRYRSLGMDFEYYVPETSLPFLGDIQRVTKDAGYMMIWKRKREIGSIAHPRYRRYAKHLEMSKNVISVDPDIAAYRVIEECTAVISMPFTSTALIARELGKPSCYYDPIGLLQKDDRAAHGIDIMTGTQELTRWLRDINSGNNSYG